MRDYFPSVLSLAEVLLRSSEPAITYFAGAMYRNAFISFDTFCQQVGTHLILPCDDNTFIKIIYQRNIYRLYKKTAPF